MKNIDINPVTGLSGLPPFVSDCLVRQLVSYMQTIDVRGSGLCYPSPQEMNMQARLIANVAKVKRLNATDFAGKIIKSFFAYLRKDDKELANILAEKYLKFTGEDIADPAIPAEVAPVAESTFPVSDTHAHAPNTPLHSNATVLPLSAPLHTEIPFLSLSDNAASLFPITQSEFEEHAPLLKAFRTSTDTAKTVFKGITVNKFWLEHNLVQYALPEKDRRFIQPENINDVRRYRSSTIETIFWFLRQKGW